MTFEQLLWSLLHLGVINREVYDREIRACEAGDSAAEAAKQLALEKWKALPWRKRGSSVWVGWEEGHNAWQAAYNAAGGVVPNE